MSEGFIAIFSMGFLLGVVVSIIMILWILRK